MSSPHKIPQDFIASVLSQIDLLELATQRGLQGKQMGQRYKALCPFHDEKSPSFNIDSKRGFYHCFGCGAHGDVIDFIMAFDRLDFIDALELLATSVGLQIPTTISNTPQKNLKPHYQLLNACTELYHKQLLRDPQLNHVRTYLKQRNISIQTCKRFQIGFAYDGWHNLNKQSITDYSATIALDSGMLTRSDADKKPYDRFRNRLMFPIRNTHGKVCGFGGRVLDDGQPKYLNSPETDLFMKHKLLYGLYEALQTEKKHPYFLVVEGYMDVVALAQHGIPLACASLGTATSKDHLRLLLRYTSHIIFCFDGDAAGRKAAVKALEQSLSFMQDGRNIEFLFLPQDSDPDSYIQEHGKDTFETFMQTALSCDDFLFKDLNSKYTYDSLAEKATYAKAALSLINLIPKGLYQHMIMQRLATHINTAVEQINSISEIKTPAAQTAKLASSSFSNTLVNSQKITHLLLHYPKLCHNDTLQQGIAQFKQQQVEKLLCYVCSQLSQHSVEAATATLIRQCESEKLKSLLTELAYRPCALDAQQALQEATDGLKQLTLAHKKHHIQQLLTAAKARTLNKQEQQQLKQLIESTTT